MVGPGVGVAGVETLVQLTARVVLLVDVTILLVDVNILCRQERSVEGTFLSCRDIWSADAHKITPCVDARQLDITLGYMAI